MPHHFDTCLPALLRIVAEAPGFEDRIRRFCVVRDLRGRLRLVLDPVEADPPDIAALQAALEQELGAWFAGPIASLQAARVDERRLAGRLFDQSRPWPATWPVAGVGIDGRMLPIDPAKWRSIQRVHSKEAWLSEEAATTPWPLRGGTPAIVSFYSYKGGVGRTTALAVLAYQLAKAGKRVLCIDLDLEAPGLAHVFGAGPEPGVLDFLLDDLVTGSADHLGLVQTVNVHGASIGVVPAGRLGPSYVEKLARLDYLATSGVAGAGAASPVSGALRRLLKALKSGEPAERPDYIFLDCRAGIHDLGGLSLNDLAHVDVLVGRRGDQGLAGLDVSLGIVARRHRDSERRLAVVQTFVPLPLDGEASQLEQAGYRERVYGLFQSHVYGPSGEDDPAEGDDTAPHFPWPIGRYDELSATDRLTSVSPSVLENQPYVALRRRLEALCASEDDLGGAGGPTGEGE